MGYFFVRKGSYMEKTEIVNNDCRKMYKYMIELKRHVFDRLDLKEKFVFRIIKAM